MILKNPNQTVSVWKPKQKGEWIFTLFIGTLIVFLGRMSMAICEVEIKNEFNWNDEQLGRVMSVFFWGYATTQILGGSAADIYGGDLTITVSSFLWGLVCLMTPFIVHLSYYCLGNNLAFFILILLRIIMGMSQGIHFPSLSSLLARRVSENNRAFAMSFISSGGQFGTLICGFLGSIILEKSNWMIVFNFFGLLGIIFSYYLFNLSVKTDMNTQRVVSLNSLEESPLIRSQSSNPKAIITNTIKNSFLFTSGNFFSKSSSSINSKTGLNGSADHLTRLQATSSNLSLHSNQSSCSSCTSSVFSFFNAFGSEIVGVFGAFWRF